MTTLPEPPAESTPSEARLRGIRRALTRYRVMAWVTGTFLAVMTLGLLWLLVTGDWSSRNSYSWYVLGWTFHGWFFVIYLITAVDLFTRVRWPVGRTLLVLVSGTIPFAAFAAEHWASGDVRRRFLEV